MGVLLAALARYGAGCCGATPSDSLGLLDSGAQPRELHHHAGGAQHEWGAAGHHACIVDLYMPIYALIPVISHDFT